MSWLLCLACALPLQDAAGSNWTLEPAEVAIGESFQLRLEVEHEAGRKLQVTSEGWLPGDWSEAWVPVDEGQLRRSEEGSTWVMNWMALEPGRFTIQLPSASLDGVELPSGAGELVVQSALLPEEDAPRPPKPLHEAPQPSAVRPWHLAALPAGVLLLAGFLLVWQRRKPVSEAKVLDPRSRLKALESSVADVDQAEGKRKQFAGELAELLRQAVERRPGRVLADEASALSPQAASDEEWLLLQRERGALESNHAQQLGELFARCERMRFGGERPTRLALEQDLRSADALLTEWERVAEVAP